MDDWGETPSVYQPTQTSSYGEEQGRSYGKGRGFIIQNNNNDEWGGRSNNEDFGGRSSNDDCGLGSGNNDHQSSSWNDNNDDFGSGRGGRGGGRGRGGRGGRGRGGGGGGGWGGYRSHNNDNEYQSNDVYKDADDQDGFQPSGGRRGGGNYRNRDDENEDGGYRRNDRNGGGFRGGRGGNRNRNRDYDTNEGENNDYGNDYEQSGGYGDGDGGRRGRGRGRGGRGGGGGGQSFGGDNEDGERPKTELYIPPELPNDEHSLFENGVAVGINFDKYDNIEVKVSGENVPQAIECFEEAGLRNIILENIKKSGYTKPTPVQKHALPIIMSGRDLMACAQTGSGKTAAFVVPIIHTLLEHPVDLVVTSSYCEPQVIIVSPTRELTIQIWKEVLKFSMNSILKTVIAYGGTSVMHQSGKLSAGCHILVATPGRLLDFLNRGRLKFSSVRFLVLDEADRMLDMGFLPSIEQIVDHETMVPLGERQTLMFSATFPDEVQHLAGRFLNAYLFLAVGIVGGACSDVEQNFYEVSKNRKTDMLREIMERENDAGSLSGTLVFVEMKRKADFIAAFLSENNYPTTSIHGDRMQRQREEALEDFKRGRMSILVATAVAARGLDIKNVSHVINYDLPKGIDEYVHRIGRTGRVGNRGRATSFFDPEVDGPLTGDLIRILKQAGQPVPDWLTSGGGSRSFAPGRGNRFGGEDVRDFNDAGGEPYGEEAYVPPVPIEPEEAW